MTLETLQKEMIAAMKAKDKVKKDALSYLIAAVKRYGIDNGVRNDITEEMTDGVLIKEFKIAQEQLDTCPAERTDLIEQYTKNLEIIKLYVPAQMGEEEIKAFVSEKFPELVATKNKGMIMKSVMAELKGKADGKLISQIVADLCK